MRQIFRQELQQVGDDLVSMAQHVATAMENATAALKNADLALAEQVIEGDETVDDLERHLSDQCLSLLALQAPVATDLRLVVSALRLSSTIERMGDLARHVALIARRRYPERAFTGEQAAVIERMSTAATDVAHQVVKLLDNHELPLAQQIKEDDTVLDDLHRTTFELALDESTDVSRQELVDLILLGRFLERFGDHGVSVANRINFLVTGKVEQAAHGDHGE